MYILGTLDLAYSMSFWGHLVHLRFSRKFRKSYWLDFENLILIKFWNFTFKVMGNAWYGYMLSLSFELSQNWGLNIFKTSVPWLLKRKIISFQFYNTFSIMWVHGSKKKRKNYILFGCIFYCAALGLPYYVLLHALFGSGDLQESQRKTVMLGIIFCLPEPLTSPSSCFGFPFLFIPSSDSCWP